MLLPAVVPDGALIFLIALQDTLSHPFLPKHLQFHGPFPDTTLAVSFTHKPAVGRVENVFPFAAQHCPFTAVGHEASVQETL